MTQWLAHRTFYLLMPIRLEFHCFLEQETLASLHDL